MKGICLKWIKTNIKHSRRNISKQTAALAIAVVSYSLGVYSSKKSRLFYVSCGENSKEIGNKRKKKEKNLML